MAAPQCGRAGAPWSGLLLRNLFSHRVQANGRFFSEALVGSLMSRAKVASRTLAVAATAVALFVSDFPFTAAIGSWTWTEGLMLNEKLPPDNMHL